MIALVCADTMATNSKNTLQEYCQKQRLPIPVYDTKSVAADANKIAGVEYTWSSSVTVHSRSGAPTTFHGSRSHTTKTSAEMEAALVALIAIDAILGSSVARLNTPSIDSNKLALAPRRDARPDATRVADNERSTLKRRTVLVVDVENMPKLAEEFIRSVDTPHNLWLVLFVGKHTHHRDATKALERHRNVSVVESPSMRKNGTDTCVQMHVAIMLHKRAFEHYLVCTRDHFGACLVEFIQDDTPMWSAQSAQIVTTLDDITNALDSIGYKPTMYGLQF